MAWRQQKDEPCKPDFGHCSQQNICLDLGRHITGWINVGILAWLLKICYIRQKPVNIKLRRALPGETGVLGVLNLSPLA